MGWRKRIFARKEDKVIMTRFYHSSTYGDDYTEIPQITLKYRFVITNSKKKLCVDAGAGDDSTAGLAELLSQANFVEDDDGQ